MPGDRTVNRNQPVEPAAIISDLRWEDATLPASVSEADLDAIIFSSLTSRLQKSAMVIGKPRCTAEDTGCPSMRKCSAQEFGL
jgi:hypothetical protein